MFIESTHLYYIPNDTQQKYNGLDNIRFIVRDTNIYDYIDIFFLYGKKKNKHIYYINLYEYIIFV